MRSFIIRSSLNKSVADTFIEMQNAELSVGEEFGVRNAEFGIKGLRRIIMPSVNLRLPPPTGEKVQSFATFSANGRQQGDKGSAVTFRYTPY